MQKTKLFVTASAVCFALAGAMLSERQSQSAILYIAGHTMSDECIRSQQTGEPNCGILNSGAQCTVFVVDSWGIPQIAPAYASPILTNLCLLPLRMPKL